jgi:hypothetical protein
MLSSNLTLFISCGRFPIYLCIRNSYVLIARLSYLSHTFNPCKLPVFHWLNTRWFVRVALYATGLS